MHLTQASQQLSVLNPGNQDIQVKQWTTGLCARYMHHRQLLNATGQGSQLDRQLVYQSLQKAVKDTPEPLVSRNERPTCSPGFAEGIVGAETCHTPLDCFREAFEAFG